MATDSTAPHVVMLVDNPVVGDSRVQKEARAMAERGWRVTLVGRRTREQQPPRGEVDGLRARFAYVAPRAGQHPALERPARLRAPLAYPTLRQRRVREAAAEIGLQRARMSIEFAKYRRRDRGLTRVRTRAAMQVARVRHRWVARRLAASERLREHRRLGTGRSDRLAAWWWRTVKGDAAWERLDPSLWDWELAYGPIVDRLRPDLIHANDHRMLHVAARAKVRAAMAGRDVKVVWDAHEWLAGLETSRAPRSWLAAQTRLERSFVPYADAVVTVSDILAEMLRVEHDLAEPPAVVCNAPLVSGTTSPERRLREVIGLDEKTPLLLYSGAISPERSVDTVVQALRELPWLHFVMVVRLPFQPIVHDLLELAEHLGVADRVHTAPYVPVDQIVPYLAGADAGVHTILHGPNNEIALATKFYEYAQARLPILVTDVKVMAETTRRTGQGEVFAAGDPADLARAATRLFSDLDRYRAAFDDAALMRSWTWEAQADVLDDVYRSTLGRGPSRTQLSRRASSATTRRAARPSP